MSYRTPLLLLTTRQIDDQSILNKLLFKSLSTTKANHTLTVLILKNITQLDDLINKLIVIYDTARFHHHNEKTVTVIYGDNYKHLPVDTWDAIITYDSSIALFDKSNYPNTPMISLSEEDLTKLTIEELPYQVSPQAVENHGTVGQYGTVAIGGTFDHMHDGHRILLTVAVFLSNNNLFVGITGDELLKNKKYAEYLESYEVREKSVERFVKFINPNQKIRLSVIQDVCGPTATTREVDALVVSSETVSGGEYINKVRKGNGLPELVVHEVSVVGGGTKEDGFKGKLSSTDFRKREYEIVKTCAN